MSDPQSESINLLHPFYLDTDMSMAFAAALTGGAAKASIFIGLYDELQRQVSFSRLS